MKIKELVEYLNHRFLPVYQEDYDNAGFLLGDDGCELSGVLCSVDVTPAVVDEAVALHANLIVSHHPLIFGAVKRITPSSATGRLALRLLQQGIAVYAAHTNLDNLDWGVNAILAEKLGLADGRILRPVAGVLRKLVTYVPTDHADHVRQALFQAGAGAIGAYDCCSFNSQGLGSFRAGQGCNPFCGTVGQLHHEPETRIEVVYEQRIERQLLNRLRDAHPYEEPAFDCLPLANDFQRVGAGWVASLPQPLDVSQFLQLVKSRLHLPVVRTSALCRPLVQRVALCGGSGSFLIHDAVAAGADILLTADLKYHDFQAADDRIVLADIGHFESEQFAKELFYRVISEKFSTFACQISEADKGYVYYI
ncbi:MAG: Nif3-like dinuclear metal center hexameric protein [Bacteroidales bacterium]|jgi:dinuclear metal center YbgI/SA1388 family protein|nr:Nif3-like dinuclear metal center hexameric protein [Bacteroidales bacterium]